MLNDDRTMATSHSPIVVGESSKLKLPRRVKLAARDVPSAIIAHLDNSKGDRSAIIKDHHSRHRIGCNQRTVAANGADRCGEQAREEARK
ncbi:MAG: hypothetical protein JNL18_02620 [Planctomycetaceae bacterium]|nr:hypothetical protein [Planctomycetaceae bacterium]